MMRPESTKHEHPYLRKMFVGLNLLNLLSECADSIFPRLLNQEKAIVRQSICQHHQYVLQLRIPFQHATDSARVKTTAAHCLISARHNKTWRDYIMKICYKNLIPEHNLKFWCRLQKLFLDRKFLSYEVYLKRKKTPFRPLRNTRCPSMHCCAFRTVFR